MKTENLIKGILPVMLVAMMSVTACANSGQKGRPQGPPPEAIKACEGKAEGDAVSFAGRRGETLEATCRTVEGQLVAVPEGHEERQRQ